MKVEQSILGFTICAQAARLDAGWDIGVFGGCKTHVGAVTFAEADGTAQTLERTGHRDSAVSERWAHQLAQTMHAPVCVRCGIHYDHATKEQLAQIMAGCEQMLSTLTAVLKQKGTCKNGANFNFESDNGLVRISGPLDV